MEGEERGTVAKATNVQGTWSKQICRKRVEVSKHKQPNLELGSWVGTRGVWWEQTMHQGSSSE